MGRAFLDLRTRAESACYNRNNQQENGETDGVMLAAAVLLFLITITFVIWQPKGLGIGWTASAGALLALVIGVVGWNDVIAVTDLVWNATLTFIAIILISLLLDEIGFFEWAALHMARLARGSGRLMFLYASLLGAIVSAMFTNDGTALILTPIVLAMVRALRFDAKVVLPFIMACGFIADTTSLPFIVSNLTNIVTADYFGIDFGAYAWAMFVPNLASLAASIGMIYIVFGRHIPRRYDASALKAPKEAIKDVKLFRLSWAILAMLLAAYFGSGFIGAPECLIAWIAALGFLLASRKAGLKVGPMLRGAPWNVVVFSIGMYVVVYGLRNVGLTDVLSSLLERFTEAGSYAAALGTGYVAAVLSSIMNNLPALMVGMLAIDGIDAHGVSQQLLAYANLIGANLGPKMTPIGSLATLLWLHVLSRKGVRITWGYYCKIGILLTVPTLFAALTGLYLWLLLIDG